MATALGIYIDDPLTTLLSVYPGIISSGVPLAVKVGSTLVDVLHRRKTLPGVNQLQLALVDNDTGDVVALTNFKFALTEGGLAAATPGAPLNLGVSIPSGVDDALQVWMLYTDTTGVVAEFPAAVSLTILDVEDFPA
jgi:hypothetical protein